MNGVVWAILGVYLSLQNAMTNGVHLASISMPGVFLPVFRHSPRLFGPLLINLSFLSYSPQPLSRSTCQAAVSPVMFDFLGAERTVPLIQKRFNFQALLKLDRHQSQMTTYGRHVTRGRLL